MHLFREPDQNVTTTELAQGITALWRSHLDLTARSTPYQIQAGSDRVRALITRNINQWVPRRSFEGGQLFLNL
ncbi:MAG TPA: hypothetical protein VE242_03270 [Chthoniobacterales bacterium]|nr:hypothetical protein [Chthoniobacterales bacterium]